jgi:hypothetical protein
MVVAATMRSSSLVHCPDRSITSAEQNDRIISLGKRRCHADFRGNEPGETPERCFAARSTGDRR